MTFLSDFLNSPEKFYSFVGAAAAVSLPLLGNFCKDLYFDYQKRKTEKNYIAVQLIYLLDNFVFTCGELAWDAGYDPIFPAPEFQYYEAQVKDPVFDLSSVKGEQKYLEPILLYRLQGISVDIARAKESLREIANSPNFGPDNIEHYFTERRRHYATIGLKVAEIVSELRVQFKVPKRDDWDPRNTIINSINQMNRERSFLQIKRMERKAQRIMKQHHERQKENSKLKAVE